MWCSPRSLSLFQAEKQIYTQSAVTRPVGWMCAYIRSFLFTPCDCRRSNLVMSFGLCSQRNQIISSCTTNMLNSFTERLDFFFLLSSVCEKSALQRCSSVSCCVFFFENKKSLLWLCWFSVLWSCSSLTLPSFQHVSPTPFCLFLFPVPCVSVQWVVVRLFWSQQKLKSLVSVTITANVIFKCSNTALW